MAKTGLFHFVAAEIATEESGVKPTYKTGFLIGKAINVDLSINTNDNPLYADGGIAENDRTFSDGEVKITTDDIDLKTEATLLGAEYIEAGVDTPERIIKSALDVAPNLGLGFYKSGIKNGEKYFEATLLFKTMFAPFSESGATKEKQIEWQTPEISGSIMTVPTYKDGAWQEKARFKTSAEAEAWIDKELSYSQPSSSSLVGE